MSGRSRLEVLEPGPLTTVQDGGRAGLAHLGVPPSGALDRPSARLANRLVGNGEDEAVLECTVAGPVLRVVGGAGALLCVTGAPAPVRAAGRAQDPGVAVWVPAGSVLQVGAATAGLRSYLAVRGGFAVDPVLGSRSYDLLSGLGPEPLRRGQLLPVGLPSGEVPAVDVVPLACLGAEVLLPVSLGPREDWLEPAAVELLTSARWTVTPDSNRIGVRLHGPRLPRRRQEQLPPEGLVTGSVQVPANGQPVLFLADHPTTGGYPVLAVVDPGALSAVAQARPGTTVRFALLSAAAGRSPEGR